VTHLLDTHVFLWLVAEPDRVDRAVIDRLADRQVTLLVSAASAWEAATKQRLGKLGLQAVVATWNQRVHDIGAEPLDITPDDVLLAGSMQWDHRDPFDRLLVSQALRLNAVLVTVDRTILAFPGTRTLTW
jgi:PIN domain nuclease of toxin-antitoxin system